MNSNDTGLYFTAKKNDWRSTRNHTGTRQVSTVGQDTQASLSSSQQSNRKSSLYNRLTTKTNAMSLHSDTDEGSSVRRMNGYSSINNKMEKFTQQKKKGPQTSFYEAAYLVGTQGEKPSILYRYGQSQVEDLLPVLLFPCGANDQQRKLSDSMSEINSILYKRHVTEDNPDCFVVPIKTPQSFEKKRKCVGDIRSGLNPRERESALVRGVLQDSRHSVQQAWLYDIRQGALHSVIFAAVSVFYRLPDFSDKQEYEIKRQIDCAKEERLKGTPFASFIQKCNLFETLPIQVPSQQISPAYYEYNHIHARKLKFLGNSILTAQITINIVMENSIVFLGPNVQSLSACLMLFLRPLVWMHQLVCCIPSDKLEILNVPVPLLAGMVVEDESEISELSEEFRNVVFVDIVRSRIYNSQDFSKSFLFIQLIKQLNGKYCDQLGPVLRTFQREGLIVRDDHLAGEFRQTQYYSEFKSTASGQKLRR